MRYTIFIVALKPRGRRIDEIRCRIKKRLAYKLESDWLKVYQWPSQPASQPTQSIRSHLSRTSNSIAREYIYVKNFALRLLCVLRSKMFENKIHTIRMHIKKSKYTQRQTLTDLLLYPQTHTDNEPVNVWMYDVREATASGKPTHSFTYIETHTERVREREKKRRVKRCKQSKTYKHSSCRSECDEDIHFYELPFSDSRKLKQKHIRTLFFLFISFYFILFSISLYIDRYLFV